MSDPAPRLCRHCGVAPASEGGGEYCCYGCELVARLAAEGAESGVRLKATLTFCLLLSMLVMMLSLFLYAEDVYPDDGGLAWMRQGYRVAAVVLSTPVVALLGAPVLRRAIEALLRGRATMDLLVGAGAVTAYVLSIAAVIRGRGGLYVDSATAALLLATAGRYLEATARAHASRLLGPTLRAASEPVLAGEPGGELRLMSPGAVRPGMIVRTQVERTVPVDLELTGHPVEVTLAVLTGAAEPVAVRPGETVPAGAVPVSADLEGVALRSASASTLERLAALARDLAAHSSPLQRMADRFASLLTPLVIVLSLSSLAVHAWRGAPSAGVVAGLAVVLAACPCTYGVITPLVLWIALRRGLLEGVCIRSAGAVEALARVRVVALDKTGTLTRPDLAVNQVLVRGISEAEALGLASALEGGSGHPVARALRDRAAGLPRVELASSRLVPGSGAIGVDREGRELLLGSPAFFRARGVAIGDDGALRVALARDGAIVATFDIGESLRPEAAEAVALLRAMKIEPVILTGDGARGAAQVAEALGVRVISGLAATDKLTELTELAGLGGGVAMVGDGLNDAPALASVEASFAMGGGASLARGVAPVILLRDDLRLVPWTIALARRTVRIARRNLALSTMYNIVFVALAATGALRPAFAGLSMLIASLLLLAGSLRAGDAAGVDGERRAQPAPDASPTGEAPAIGAIEVAA